MRSYSTHSSVLSLTHRNAAITTTNANTAAVFAFVVVMAIFLWISDKTLEWVLYDLLLGWKKT